MLTVHPGFHHDKVLLRQAEQVAEWLIKRLGLEAADVGLAVHPGLMFYAEGACGRDSKTGEITILINPYSYEDVSKVVAHEMVHAWQMHRGDLDTCSSTGTVFWKGEAYPYYAGAANRDSPWEQEAYELMDILAAEYCASLQQRRQA